MTVIIHGWSDNAKSFTKLAGMLDNATVTNLYLGDYISLNDAVTFDDLSDALQRAWEAKGLSSSGPRTVDVIVHSTGGLIIRHWLVKYYGDRISEIPIHRLVMLAPANFGSPLAHKGRSIIGRVSLGWNWSNGKKLFETGTHLLQGLELASPFTWRLAEKDLLADEGKSFYGKRKILCTVLTGNKQYDGIRALISSPGSDGTVRVSTANLLTRKIAIDLSETPKKKNGITETQELVDERIGEREIAFGIMDGIDHSSIVAPKKRSVLLACIKKALAVTDEGFSEWRAKLAQTVANSTCEERFQNIVVHVTDTQGNDVEDFVLELFINNDKTKADCAMTRDLQRAIDDVHANKGNPSYRCFFLNCEKLSADILAKEADNPVLWLSITAMPDVDRDCVGYRTCSAKDIDSLQLAVEDMRKLFVPHETLLIEIKIQRFQKDNVFALKTKREVEKEA